VKERGHLEDLNVDRKIVLKLILKKLVGRMWTGLIQLRMRTNGRLL
jgi:hypothetical protein